MKPLVSRFAVPSSIFRSELSELMENAGGSFTRWNDKIVVQKKTTLQLYFKTFIEKIIFFLHLFNVAAFSLNHHLDTDPELGACFSTSAGGSSAITRRMAAIRLALVLWKVMLVMFSTYD